MARQTVLAQIRQLQDAICQNILNTTGIISSRSCNVLLNSKDGTSPCVHLLVIRTKCLSK